LKDGHIQQIQQQTHFVQVVMEHNLLVVVEEEQHILIR
jgi:hypothetical protein